jgi:hypothetical protein
MRHALIDDISGLVVNVVEIDAGDSSADPEGCTHIASDIANIGDRWDGKKFIIEGLG